MKILLTSITILCLLCGPAAGQILNVPDDYPTIQSAIDSAEDLDIVVVAPGLYTGSGNRNISFRGKQITVRSIDPDNKSVVSGTIIDCDGSYRGFQFLMAEDTRSELSGLTISNGYGSLGGAIYCYNNSSPTIKNCVIKGGRGTFGGAIACSGSGTQPVIKNCMIFENTSLVIGGAIYVNTANPIIKNCIIAANTSRDGAAIYCHNPGKTTVINCTIVNNNALTSAGGIYCHSNAEFVLANSILWGNQSPSASQIRVGTGGDSATISASYCDIQGGIDDIVALSPALLVWGEGNINVNPVFLTTAGGIEDSYRLDSSSSCINAGDPDYQPAPDDTDIDGEPRLLGSQIDMGADEYLLAIDASIKAAPDKINLKGNNKWLTIFIALPAGYNPADIETSSIILNEKVVPYQATLDIENNKLITKFYTDYVLNTIDTTAESATIIINGQLTEGQKFKGSCIIKIKQPKENNKDNPKPKKK